MTISVSTPAISAPVDVAAGSVDSTLTLTNNGTGTSTFTGNSNPAIPAEQPRVHRAAERDRRRRGQPGGQVLKVVVMGITVTCNATSAQAPGPFVF